MDKDIIISTRTILILLTSVLVLWLMIQISGILLSVFVALILTLGLNPLVDWLAERKLSRTLAVVLTYIIFLSIVIGLFALAFPLIISQLQKLVERLPLYVSSVSIPGFESLDRPERAENAGQMAGIDELNTEIRAITADRESGDLVEAFRSRNIPIAKVSTVKDLFDDPYVSARLMRVRDPVGGFEAELAPPPTPPSEAAWSDPESRTLRDFPPRLGEQNQALLGDLLGYDLEQLRDEGVA